MSIELTVDAVREKILSLKSSLDQSLPDFPHLLRQIHTNLREDPSIVTDLSEDEISIIVNGLKKQTGIAIVGTAAKKSSKKAVAKLSLDDL